MNTIFQKIDMENIDIVVLKKATNILKKDGLVAFPTETVYGLGANALSKIACQKIYNAKGRPSDNPLIVHIDKIEDAFKLAKVNSNALKLMNKFWPGPLTLILKKSFDIPDIVTGGLNTVALRLPSNKIAQKLIKLCGFPIAAPSANLSGRPSPTNANHVFNDLNNKIDMILDGGDCQVGLESTVVEVLENEIIILRPGSITKEMLEEVLPNITLDKSILNTKIDLLPKSPGMKYKHYAPKGEITIFKGNPEKVSKEILSLLQKDPLNSIAILSNEILNNYQQFQNFKTINIGDFSNKNQVAKNLFSSLRKCDALNIKKIYIQAISEDDIGLAIMNRLNKAANYNIINL